MTFSIERALVGLSSGAAVAAQGIWESFYRPFGHDWDVCLAEPPLSDDELVAVRGLIQERYDNQSSPAAPPVGERPAAVDSPPAAAGLPDLELPWAVEDFTDIPWHTGTGMQYGISNKHGIVIAHFDRREVAEAAVKNVNTKGGEVLLW